MVPVRKGNAFNLKMFKEKTNILLFMDDGEIVVLEMKGI